MTGMEITKARTQEVAEKQLTISALNLLLVVVIGLIVPAVVAFGILYAQVQVVSNRVEAMDKNVERITTWLQPRFPVSGQGR